jgi:hypothetical protein
MGAIGRDALLFSGRLHTPLHIVILHAASWTSKVSDMNSQTWSEFDRSIEPARFQKTSNVINLAGVDRVGRVIARMGLLMCDSVKDALKCSRTNDKDPVEIPHVAASNFLCGTETMRHRAPREFSHPLLSLDNILNCKNRREEVLRPYSDVGKWILLHKRLKLRPQS